MRVVVGDGGDDSGGSVGGRGDDAASGGVLFVDGHGVDGDPVDGRERVAATPSILARAGAQRADARGGER